MIGVYFVQGKITKLIKIGYADDVSARLVCMQTGSPDVLELLHVIEATGLLHARMIEEKLHAKFEADRGHGEWHKPSRNLLKFIKNARTSENYKTLESMAGWNLSTQPA